MEENATQKATQPFMDQRRDEHQTMDNEIDEGDIICILHPASVPACRAVELIASATPQHILLSRVFNKPENQDPQAEVDHDSNDQHQTSLRSAGSGKEAAGEEAEAGTTKDIALRLTSRVRNPAMGFVFGRGAKSCDLMLSEESDYSRKISGSHFRIFFNHLGVLMLEDMSTNGTVVDKNILHSSRADKKRMITHGEIIEIILNGHENACMRFIVMIPPRPSAENPFAHNLAKYIAWRDQAARRAEVFAQAAVDGRPQTMPPVVCRTIPL